MTGYVTTTVTHDKFTEVDGDRIRIEREDYADPSEAPGVVLRVAGRGVMLSTAEAVELARALLNAATPDGVEATVSYLVRGSTALF